VKRVYLCGDFLNKLLTLKHKIISFRDQHFPERQLFLRSEGRVRFLTIGTNTQVVAASATSIFLLWGAITTYAYLTHDLMLEEKNQTISNMSDQYQTLSSDFSALEVEIEKRAKQLEERQKFLEEIVDTKPAPLVYAPAKDKMTPEENNTTKNKTSLLDVLIGRDEDPNEEITTTERRKLLLSRLQKAEQKQRQMAKYLLANLQYKSSELDSTLAPIKITQDDLIEQRQGAMGGPYDPDTGFDQVFASHDNEDFTVLLEEWQKHQDISMALASFPVGEPAEKYYISSKFGRRIDPLKKTRANHPGLDLAGWPGTAILATAPGTVVHSGWFGPYGKMIEIDHGNGFKTRYGHMRKLHVKKGETVDLGTKIGEMGKTGRVTGTHLHYEIWFEGKVRDPLPYLKAASNVLKIQGRYEKTS